MIQLESANLVAAVAYVTGAIADWRLHIQLINQQVCPPHFITLEYRTHFLKSMERIRDVAGELDMVVSHAAAERAFEACLDSFAIDRRYSAVDLQNIVSHGDRVVHAFTDELRARLVFVMPSKHASYYSDDPPFGQAVDDAFPSSNPEIVEASKCRALGRWTASVMHLMRALEPALKALQAAVQVNVPKENWDQIINQIEAKIREITKRSHGRADEQWYSEAASHFRIIKNAWRNYAAHVHERYDEERAVTIYDSTRSFMQHLAERLSE